MLAARCYPPNRATVAALAWRLGGLRTSPLRGQRSEFRRLCRSLVPVAPSQAWKRFSTRAGAVAISFVGGALTWRWYCGDLLKHDVVHRDVSQVSVVSPAVVLVCAADRESAGNSDVLGIDPVDLGKLREALLSDVEDLRAPLVSRGRSSLAADLNIAFEPAHDRIVTFADWYFKYQTTYKLLVRAIGAAGRHVKNIGSTEKLTDAISRELEEHICDQFLKIVLRPESTDAACSAAFKNSMDSCRDHFQTAVSTALRVRMKEFCTSPDAIQLKAPKVQSTLRLDWRSQSFKAQCIAAAHEKNPEVSVALVAMGAAIGKTVGGKAAAIASGKALTMLSSKLSAPFATKVITMLGPTAIGLGAALAGPLGALSGAAAGIATDMLLNAGSELLQRSSFEREAHDALHAIQKEWEGALGDQFESAVEEWCQAVPEATKGWLHTGR